MFSVAAGKLLNSPRHMPTIASLRALSVAPRIAAIAAKLSTTFVMRVILAPLSDSSEDSRPHAAFAIPSETRANHGCGSVPARIVGLTESWASNNGEVTAPQSFQNLIDRLLCREPRS